MKITPRTRAEVFLFGNTIVWGSTFVIIKDALAYASPMMFVSFRFLLAALILFILFRPYLKNVSFRHKRQGFILGVFLFIGFATQTIGLLYTSATKSAFITGTFVVFTPIFQAIWEKRLPTKGNVIGIVLVFSGIILLSSRGDNFLSILYETGSTFNIGDFLTLICAVSYAVYMVYIDIISKENDYRLLTFSQIVTTGALSLLSAGIFSLVGIEPLRFELQTSLILSVVYTTVAATIFTTMVQARFQKDTTPTKTSIIFSFEPVFAAVFAYLVIDEAITNIGIAGGVLIILGLLISELQGKD